MGSGTILDALLEPFAKLLAMHDELLALERNQLTDEKALARYGELQERYSHEGGYELESRVKALAHDLGFADADLERSVDTLSGGERGRLELAKVLLDEPDLLLLDEPTNHLDVDGHRAPRGVPAEWPKAFVLVSHDRYFLRAVCREIVELEDGKAVVYPCGYDKYVVERAERHRAAATPPTSGRRSRSRDRGLHPPQHRRAEDQAGAERGARCSRSWSGCRAHQDEFARRGQDRAALLRRRSRRRQGGAQGRAPRRRLSRRDAADPRRQRSTSTAAIASASSGPTAAASRRC